MLPTMQSLGVTIAWELALAIALAIGVSAGRSEWVDEQVDERVEQVQETETETPAQAEVTPQHAEVRQVAKGTAAVLSQVPQTLVFPAWMVERVPTLTAVYYFSPTCPHCQDRIPEILGMVAEGSMAWLGVASSSATQSEIDFFKAEYKVPFALIQDDENGTFANTVGAKRFPSLYILEPPLPGAEAAPGTLILQSSVAPFHPGSSKIFSMRQDPGDPFKAFDGYVGPATCGACHTQETESWGLTHHAIAYRTLVARERQQDTACVGCHVTGMGQDGGFVLGEDESQMRDVTCEACHGPGGPHNPIAAKVDPRGSCVGCHDAEHSIAFSVEKGMPHIDHFAAVGIPRSEWRDKKLALLRGEAPRPLLAFPEGPTVGAKACKSCHSKSHKGWKRAPHGRAMASLTLEQRTQVGCVRCHATPRIFGGPPPTEVTGYRLDESVGCEACHGAGERHAADPGTDNIVSLGGSCPECVIEALCTSCHTPRWDKTWELQARLQAAKHP